MDDFFLPSSGNTVIYNAAKTKTDKTNWIKVEEKKVAPATEEVDRSSKPIGEIRKSFEKIKVSVSVKAGEDDVIPPNLVKEMRKSFENMPFPDPPSEQVGIVSDVLHTILLCVFYSPGAPRVLRQLCS